MLSRRKFMAAAGLGIGAVAATGVVGLAANKPALKPPKEIKLRAFKVFELTNTNSTHKIAFCKFHPDYSLNTGLVPVISSNDPCSQKLSGDFFSVDLTKELGTFLGFVVASDVVQAVKQARTKYPHTALRVEDKQISVECRADASEPNMEELYKVVREEEDFRNSGGFSRMKS
jgi:hypothetical protein